MAPHVEKQYVAESFGKAASNYDEYARIQHRIAHDLISRCPAAYKEHVLDLGCGTGYCLPLLAENYPKASITGADLSQGMLDYAQAHFPDYSYEIADAEKLPFSDEQFDLIYSNFAVQWCDDFSKVLSEAYRCLKPGGHLVLSTLADGTLKELKQAWAQADQFQHVNDFEKSDFLSKCVGQSQFTVDVNVVNTEFHYYATVRELTDSLKRIGAHNITQGRAKSLTSPGTIKKFTKALQGFRTEQGLPASYEVFTIVLCKPQTNE